MNDQHHYPSRFATAYAFAPHGTLPFGVNTQTQFAYYVLSVYVTRRSHIDLGLWRMQQNDGEELDSCPVPLDPYLAPHPAKLAAITTGIEWATRTVRISDAAVKDLASNMLRVLDSHGGLYRAYTGTFL